MHCNEDDNNTKKGLTVKYNSSGTYQEEEVFDLEKIKDELLYEEYELKEYRLYSKIALAGLWLSFLIVALSFIKTV